MARWLTKTATYRYVSLGYHPADKQGFPQIVLYNLTKDVLKFNMYG